MVAIARLGALLGFIFLSSCSQHLNTSRIEANIQDDIERQGRRLALKDVICPQRVTKQAEAYFRCVGELPDGGQFTINVIQQDDQGTVTWDVPSSKVLINLASLEENIQKEIKGAVGKNLAIDCRDTYRANQRGDTFECDIVGDGQVATGRVESILVKVNGEGNLEWQEVVIGNTVPTTAAPGTATQTTAPVDSKPATSREDAPAEATTTANTAFTKSADEDDDEKRQ